jgi:hypothetical protein
VLDVKKGQAESLLQELRYGRRGRRAQYSMTVQFHIHLLSLIQKDAGKEYEFYLITIYIKLSSFFFFYFFFFFFKFFLDGLVDYLLAFSV